MAETLTKEAFTETPAEEERPLPRGGKAPPREGICKRCGENKPVNRLMLCYACWVKVELEKTGWREGMPHPDSCHCEGLSAHTRRADGN